RVRIAVPLLAAVASLMPLAATTRASHCGATGYPADCCSTDQCCAPCIRYHTCFQTVVEDRTCVSYRPVYHTAMKECRYTVCRPVYEQCFRECRYTTCRAVPETYEVERKYTVCRPVYE